MSRPSLKYVTNFQFPVVGDRMPGAGGQWMAFDLQIAKLNGDTCGPRHDMQGRFATTFE
jgi:hypothetical protein